MIVDAFVEIPKGSRNKYEYDPLRNRIRLDRVLYSPLHYPADYGFIVDTLAEDGDHLDVLIATYEPTFPGCLVPVRPVGVLDMVDEKGRDQKILAVPAGDPRFAEVVELAQLPPHFLAEIEHFFTVYKTLERKPTEVLGWSGRPDAERTIHDAQNRFRSRAAPVPTARARTRARSRRRPR
ncbi:MAG: inorganic diphosphatase [Armatimonadota bacterium]|nr:inorganic diphosphatase [Armatimonadota bacterium]MDR7400717.1 inorganic diphosphatase [Armatimonadota bacterium]MDR7403650.1 inorganic diphosphatase [Armatimonadota bacterium]MDR7436472.1 inorganic diphosphatase [Armatimonadota bacterium]MDR7472507.1 inorganic diphosphatase [Armatimonadota bacterium]